MNSTHDNGENGKPLDVELDRIGRAYSQLGREEPPELLDMAIRNSARRAVEKTPRRMKFGWLHGLTTAAVFVLALSIIIHQRENQPAMGNGVQFDRLQPGSVASPEKKQSLESLSVQVPPESEASGDTRTDLTEPAAAPTVSEPRDQALGDTPREHRQKVSATRVQQSAAVAADEVQVIMPETYQLEKADSQASKDMDMAKEEAGIQTAKPAEFAATPHATAARSSIDAKAEEQLRAIVRMKQNGDANWKAELETFIENYPGYPLPDELKD